MLTALNMSDQRSATRLYVSTYHWVLLVVLVTYVCVVSFMRSNLRMHSFQSVWSTQLNGNFINTTLIMAQTKRDMEKKINNDTRKGSQRNAVVIVTQGRSGSTFLGNIIKLDKNVFYVYEPLYYLNFDYQLLTHANGIKRPFVNYIEEADRTFINLLTCNITGLPFEFFVSWANQTNNQGDQLLSFYRKFQGVSDLKDAKKTSVVFESNMLELENHCKEASAVVIKTIRFPLFELRPMMSIIENLKIILLIRDPRPVITSQYALFFNGNVPITKLAYSVCSKMLNDISTIKILACHYTSKVKLQLYELFVSNIYKETQMIYKFLNLTYSKEVIKGVKHMTSVNGNSPYSTYRKDSKDLVSLWRKKITFKMVKEIDSMCKNVYSLVGYCTVDNESSLMNTTLPLYGEICHSYNTSQIVCPMGVLLP